MFIVPTPMYAPISFPVRTLYHYSPSIRCCCPTCSKKLYFFGLPRGKAPSAYRCCLFGVLTRTHSSWWREIYFVGVKMQHCWRGQCTGLTCAAQRCHLDTQLLAKSRLSPIPRSASHPRPAADSCTLPLSRHHPPALQSQHLTCICNTRISPTTTLSSLLTLLTYLTTQCVTICVITHPTPPTQRHCLDV